MKRITRHAPPTLFPLLSVVPETWILGKDVDGLPLFTADAFECVLADACTGDGSLDAVEYTCMREQLWAIREMQNEVEE